MRRQLYVPVSVKKPSFPRDGRCCSVAAIRRGDGYVAALSLPMPWRRAVAISRAAYFSLKR
jgi:hypothetical protein